MEEERLKAILESLLFAAGEPITLAQMVSALETVPRDDIRRALGEMAVAYAEAGRGLVLEEVAGGYQLRTPREHAAYVRRLLAARPPRLSRPLMETVAIVAYRQPITRPEIEQLRGVDCGGVIDTLLERQLIKIAGRKEAPGRPIVYATTPEFLELFGLKDLASLPDLEEFREIELPRDDAPVIEADATGAMEEPRLSSASTDSADESQSEIVAEADPPAASETASASGESDEPSAQDSDKSN
ncbi:SMC-Scp complex subunit ScpB [bacterium]|nr:SMC-Scp complex subunit ScpB [bacterium]